MKTAISDCGQHPPLSPQSFCEGERLQTLCEKPSRVLAGSSAQEPEAVFAQNGKPVNHAGDFRIVRLTKGYCAKVDAADFDLVSKFKWQTATSGSITYAHNTKVGMMHRFLLGAPEGTEVDHRNFDGLDNRRNNLRLATRSQQMANRRKFNGAKHGDRESNFKGVSPRGKKWAAYIGARRIYLGVFPCPTTAAHAYDRAAIRLFGEFACLNFPNGRAA